VRVIGDTVGPVPRVTLQTIADRVGVSRMTVSNAFSRPDQLSGPLRDRILAAARELGYVGPDPTARALAKGTTGAVGILLTDSLRYAFTDLIATRFLGAISRELEPTGLALTLLTAATGDGVVPARDVAIDGALVYSCDPTSPAVDILKRRGLPLVFVDQTPADGITSVNIDDRAGARAAAQHLIDLGHRRIGIVMSGVHGPVGVIDNPGALASVDGHASTQRRLGWFDALDAAGIQPAVVRVRHVEPDAVRECARLLLDDGDRPTAVLCFSDAIADGVIQTAADLGLRVPADVSVVGFDDNPLAVRMEPKLTTVRQDVAAKGRMAAAALVDAIGQGRADPAQEARHILLPTELVVRDSTAPPPR
jgi:DNA-binding LacI/PurR family transcriptional regulator